MRADLLEVLAEPGTGSALDLVVTRRGGDDGEEILDGTLTSRQTGKTFAITNGIPRFVPAENYADSFGMQWNRFRKVQLDSVNGTELSRDRFTSETGWAVSDLKDKWTLDMGCGAGRFAEVAASGDSRFVGLDISSAVEATRDTLRERFPRAEVVQGDILNPPFRHGSFDYVYCLGVLQHTPDNAGGVRSVVRMTKKGGRFAMTIYGRKPWTKLNTKYLIRPLTKRLPAQALLAGIEKVMPVAFPLTDKLFRLPVVGRVARFTIPIYNYTGVDALNVDDKLRYDFAVLDTFDGLAPAHDHPMTAGEVERAIRDVGAASFAFQTRIPVVVSGTRLARVIARFLLPQRAVPLRRRRTRPPVAASKASPAIGPGSPPVARHPQPPASSSSPAVIRFGPSELPRPLALLVPPRPAFPLGAPALPPRPPLGPAPPTALPPARPPFALPPIAVPPLPPLPPGGSTLQTSSSSTCPSQSSSRWLHVSSCGRQTVCTTPAAEATTWLPKPTEKSLPRWPE